MEHAMIDQDDLRTFADGLERIQEGVASLAELATKLTFIPAPIAAQAPAAPAGTAAAESVEPHVDDVNRDAIRAMSLDDLVAFRDRHRSVEHDMLTCGTCAFASERLAELQGSADAHA